MYFDTYFVNYEYDLTKGSGNFIVFFFLIIINVRLRPEDMACRNVDVPVLLMMIQIFIPTGKFEWMFTLWYNLG